MAPELGRPKQEDSPTEQRRNSVRCGNGCSAPEMIVHRGRREESHDKMHEDSKAEFRPSNDNPVEIHLYIL